MMKDDKTTREPHADERPVMVNVTRMDRTRYFEAVRARGRSARSRILLAGGVIVTAAGLLMGNRLAAGLGLLIAVLTILSPELIGRRDFRRLCALHPGEEWTKTIRFYEDRLETETEGGPVRSAPYSAIRRDGETEHMFILEFGREMPATAFSKDGFTVGSAEAFPTFLTEVRRRVYDDPPEKNVDEQSEPE